MAGEDSVSNAAAHVFVPPSIHSKDLHGGASYTHYSPIPSLVTVNRCIDDAGTTTTGTPCVLGIDEAGRGPVIGPMIYGAFYLPTELHHSLLATTHHFDDSKVLSPAVRSNLMRTLCTPDTDLFKSGGWAIRSLSARDIGAGMLKNGGSYNLNAQAMDATIEIIRGILERGVNVEQIYVDTIGIPAVYQKKLERFFPTIKVVVEKKADSLFPCVSAASVVAKVTRDVSCDLLYQQGYGDGASTLSSELGVGWGSGYPSDTRCVVWMKSEKDPLFGWGNECRFSWGTAKDMLDNSATGGLKIQWPDDADDGNARLSSYFAGDNEGPTTERKQLQNWFGARAGQESF